MRQFRQRLPYLEVLENLSRGLLPKMPVKEVEVRSEFSHPRPVALIRKQKVPIVDSVAVEKMSGKQFPIGEDISHFKYQLKSIGALRFLQRLNKRWRPSHLGGNPIPRPEAILVSKCAGGVNQSDEATRSYNNFAAIFLKFRLRRCTKNKRDGAGLCSNFTFRLLAKHELNLLAYQELGQ